MRLRCVGIVTAMVLCCAGASGVVAENASGASNVPKEVLANGSLGHTLMAQPVLGQPYSAVQRHKTVRTLADGTKITHAGHHNVARDSQGRVRVEMRIGKGENGAPDPVTVFVLDPVAHRFTTWSTGPQAQKVAVTVKLPDQRKGAAPAKSAKVDSLPQPVVTTESLPDDVLEGLPVKVVKITTVVPVGRSGNDAPITKTDEVWTSEDLKLLLKEQWEDPRTGERTIALEHLSRAEPDPALFRAPVDYVVKDIKQTLEDLQQKLSEMQN